MGRNPSLIQQSSAPFQLQQLDELVSCSQPMKLDCGKAGGLLRKSESRRRCCWEGRTQKGGEERGGEESGREGRRKERRKGGRGEGKEGEEGEGGKGREEKRGTDLEIEREKDPSLALYQSPPLLWILLGSLDYFVLEPNDGQFPSLTPEAVLVITANGMHPHSQQFGHRVHYSRHRPSPGIARKRFP